MGNLNKVQLIGRLGNDPDIKTLDNGNKLANLSVATSESWTDKNGEKQERTEWHRVVIWGKLADIVEDYLRKGSLVYLEGKLQTRKWQDQSGADRYSTEIVLQGFDCKMQMLSGKSSGDSGGQSDYSAPAQSQDDFEDEIPFD